MPREFRRQVSFLKGRTQNGHDSNQDIPTTYGKECKEVFSRFPPDAFEEWRRETAAGREGVPFKKKKVTAMGY